MVTFDINRGISFYSRSIWRWREGYILENWGHFKKKKKKKYWVGRGKKKFSTYDFNPSVKRRWKVEQITLWDFVLVSKVFLFFISRVGSTTFKVKRKIIAIYLALHFFPSLLYYFFIDSFANGINCTSTKTKILQM